MLIVVAKKKPKPTAFGVTLKRLREAKGLSQSALAEAIGVQRLAIWRLESSPLSNPTLDTIRKLAEALGVAPADLLADEGG